MWDCHVCVAHVQPGTVHLWTSMVCLFPNSFPASNPNWDWALQGRVGLFTPHLRCLAWWPAQTSIKLTLGEYVNASRNEWMENLAVWPCYCTSSQVIREGFQEEVWRGCVARRAVFRQRVQPGQRFRDQAAFYSFGNWKQSGWRSEGEGGRSWRRRGQAGEITHCQEGVDFALSRRGDRAWDEASETREGAKDSQLSWCPPSPQAAYCCVDFGQVASSFWVSVLPSVKWVRGSYEGRYQTVSQRTLP